MDLDLLFYYYISNKRFLVDILIFFDKVFVDFVDYDFDEDFLKNLYCLYWLVCNVRENLLIFVVGCLFFLVKNRIFIR